MMTYFLQVNVCWLLFYGLYAALLSRETFFRLNRAYLLLSLVAGLLLPMSQYIVAFEANELATVMLRPFIVRANAVRDTLAATQYWQWSQVLTALYVVGAMFFATRLLMGIAKIVQLYRLHPKTITPDFTLVQTATLPFSFFRCVFLTPEQYDASELAQILHHEQIHIRQRHSWDILLVEALQVVFWCSPLPLLYKKSLQNVHEYLADAGVLQTAEPRQYGRLLIKQLQQARALPFTHHFFFSSLSKRILMMTRNRSQRTMLAKYALALPVYLGLLVAFAMPNSPILAKVASVTRPAVPVTEPSVMPTPTTVAPKPTVLPLVAASSKITAVAVDTAPPLRDVAEKPTYIGGDAQLFKFLGENIKYPKKAVNERMEAMVLVDFVVETDGSLSNIVAKRLPLKQNVDTIAIFDPETYKKSIKFVTAMQDMNILGDEAARVVGLMAKKQWIAGKDDKGKAVRVAFTLPITFRLE